MTLKFIFCSGTGIDAFVCKFRINQTFRDDPSSRLIDQLVTTIGLFSTFLDSSHKRILATSFADAAENDFMLFLALWILLASSNYSFSLFESTLFQFTFCWRSFSWFLTSGAVFLLWATSLGPRALVCGCFLRFLFTSTVLSGSLSRFFFTRILLFIIFSLYRSFIARATFSLLRTTACKGVCMGTNKLIKSHDETFSSDCNNVSKLVTLFSETLKEAWVINKIINRFVLQWARSF